MQDAGTQRRDAGRQNLERPLPHICGTHGWLKGTKIYNVAPAAGGFEGWVCTASGTPGTRNTFGAISA